MPATNGSRELRRQRLCDIQDAIERGECVADLARRWGITRQRASQWLTKYADESARREIAGNGTLVGADKRRCFDVVARLELFDLCKANGWSNEKIGLAIGVSAIAVWSLINHHAPDGLAAAIQDMRDDEREAA